MRHREPHLTGDPQTTVMEISMTFDPMVLVEWARAQKGVCCDEPAHDIDPGLDARRTAGAVHPGPRPLRCGAYAISLETGIPEEMDKRHQRERTQDAVRDLQDTAGRHG